VKLAKNRWPSTPRARNFRFLAETLLELLDSHTWDSFRADTLSITGLSSELHAQLERVKRKSVPKDAIRPIADEFNRKIMSDEVSRRILKTQEFSPEHFKMSAQEPTETLTRRTALLSSLISESYLEECEREILDFCLSDGKKKKKVTSICKSYIPTLVHAGLSREHLYSTTMSFFFEVDISRCDQNLLKRYFRHLRPKPSVHFVYFGAQKDFANFLQTTLACKLLSNPSEAKANNAQNKLDKLFRSPRFRVVELEIDTRDHFSAKYIAGKILKIAAVSGQLLPQSRIPKTMQLGVIANEVKTVTFTKGLPEDKPVPKSLSQRRHDPEASILKYLFRRGNDEITISRLIRSIAAAADSVSSKSNETGIVNIWSAFEALLPEPTTDKEKAVRISHFVDLLVPCILNDHIKTIFETQYRNFRNEFGDGFSKFIEENGIGITKAEKFASIALGENDKQKQLLNLVRECPLAVFRLATINERFTGARNLLDRITDTSKTIEWQLHRIYRERNLIVHDSSPTKSLASIMEHAYSYYQSTIYSIERVSRKTKITTSDQAVELVGISFRRKISELESLAKAKKSAEVEQSILRQMIFSDI
jgi:hypothetical protein